MWPLDKLRGKLNEIAASVSLHHSLDRAGWVIPDLFTDGAAGSATLQLFLLKAMLLRKPATVLEFGSGQTTKLISRYAAQSGASALTLEQSATWHDRIKSSISHDYRHAPLRSFPFNGGTTSWYDCDLTGRQFELVLVDGPDHGLPGTANFPWCRAGILQHLPHVLADSWVLVFDDAERRGERQTIDAARKLLPGCVSFDLLGTKRQAVLCSRDNAWLASV